jgi:hypothetical protein
MIKHLSADTKHEVAANYAVSVAETFGANLAAVTFALEGVWVGSRLTLSTSSARSPRRLPTQP